MENVVYSKHLLFHENKYNCIEVLSYSRIIKNSIAELYEFSKINKKIIL